MKKTLLAAATVVLFLVFLGLGLLTGRRLLNQAAPTPAALDLLEEAVPTQQVLQRTATLQPSGEMVLILHTSRRDWGHSLEGVWLLSTDRIENRGNFLPVLPSQAEDGLVRDQILRAAYRPDDQGHPGADFFRVLEERNLRWNGYLVVSEKKLSSLVGAFDKDFPLPDSSVESLRYLPEAADRVRLHQAEVLRSACARLNQKDLPPQAAEQIQALLDQPGLAGTSAAGKVFAPAREGSREPVACTFPTLSGSSR